MYISTWQFLLFLIVLIVLEVIAKDTNVIVIAWTFVWSIWVYLMNLSGENLDVTTTVWMDVETEKDCGQCEAERVKASR